MILAVAVPMSVPVEKCITVKPTLAVLRLIVTRGSTPFGKQTGLNRKSMSLFH